MNDIFSSLIKSFGSSLSHSFFGWLIVVPVLFAVCSGVLCLIFGKRK